jgi:hypothetical protein
MHDLGQFVCPEEEGPCGGQSHGLYSLQSLCQCPLQLLNGPMSRRPGDDRHTPR